MAVDPLMLLLMAARRYDPDNNPWDPPLRPYFPAPRQRRQPSIARHATLDGGMRNEWGAPVHHPLLHVLDRRAKRSHF